MEQLRQASPVARAAGRALATQTFALLKRNGEKGRTETLAQRRAGDRPRSARRQPGQRSAARRSRSVQRELGGRAAGGGAETPRSPLPPRPAQRSAAALCRPLAAGRPALRCPDGAAAAPGLRSTTAPPIPGLRPAAAPDPACVDSSGIRRRRRN